jgi:hypothetical protein
MNNSDLAQIHGLGLFLNFIERDAAQAAENRRRRMWDRMREEDPESANDAIDLENERRGWFPPEE